MPLSSHPGLAAQHVQHTLRMLAVAVAQLEASLRESESSVNTLSNSFTRMVGQLEATAKSPAHEALASELEDLHAETVRCVVSFQFFDKMAQRLGHVKTGLQDLADLIGDPARLEDDSSWLTLQQSIRNRYTMKEERDMFDAILQGATVEAALAAYLEAIAKPAANESDDIELF
ncbi:MAG: hypothetical protein D6758_01940 [Gammaproteobacteria bacterium]|nr:MAG: hypothetical protein D6758_01940 [Gammaproteobacteria bacterium]